MRYLRVYRDIFGDDFYIEIQPHDIDDQRQANISLLNVAMSHGIAVVAAGDVHYPHKDWHDTQDVLVMISTKQTKTKRELEDLEGKGYMKFTGESFYLTTDKEIASMFSEHHPSIPADTVRAAINNTKTIADRCEHFTISKAPKIPRATKSTLEAERILRKWCQEGLVRIGKTDDPVYLERIETELGVMRRLGVLDYFVIVTDMVRWAKKEGIRVGAGRGSAAGSLVNYLNQVTCLDPIGYGLLFERFLNEYRTELPDIDIDFQKDRRDEVRDYLASKWGKDHVVDVASFTTFGLKAVIQDVCRALSIPFEKARKATNAIPEKTWGEDLESLEGLVLQLAELFEEYPDVKRHSIRLQGQAKNQSRHAAAVILTNQPAQNLIPTMRAKDGGVVTQWTERANGQIISTYGFLKIDMLSTDGLRIQQKCLDLIDEDIDFESTEQFPFIANPDLTEPDIIEAFGEGTNLGIFQMSSPIMKNLLKEIKPDSMNNLIAANALIRPGAARKEFAQRKNGKTWKLPSESVGKYLNETYGIVTYQEQIMSIVKELGEDITSEDSAVLLKIVAKGIARDIDTVKKLNNYKERFSKGCLSKGMTKTEANKIWKELTAASAEYSFNKSHAAGYAVQAYQDMWLKKRYPLQYYTALLSVETTKIPQIIKEAKAKGIEILPPDINISDRGFTIDGDRIRIGLVAIKGLGDATTREILSYRPFKSYEDMVTRMPTNKMTKARKEVLLGSGAFDCWGGRSKWILNQDASAKISGSWNEDEKAKAESELLGLVLSKESDIEKYRSIIQERIVEAEKLENLDDQEVLVGGEIVSVKEYKTRNGDTMAFVNLEFDHNEYSLTLWPRFYDDHYSMVREGNIVLVIGDWQKGRQATVVKQLTTAASLAEDLNGRP